MTDQPPPPPGNYPPLRLHPVVTRRRLRRRVVDTRRAPAGRWLPRVSAGRWLQRLPRPRWRLPAAPGCRSGAAQRGLHAVAHPRVGLADRRHPAGDPGGHRMGSVARHPRDRVHHRHLRIRPRRVLRHGRVDARSGRLSPSRESSRSSTGSGISAIGRAQLVRASASR